MLGYYTLEEDTYIRDVKNCYMIPTVAILIRSSILLILANLNGEPTNSN